MSNSAPSPQTLNAEKATLSFRRSGEIQPLPILRDRGGSGMTTRKVLGFLLNATGWVKELLCISSEYVLNGIRGLKVF